MLNGGKMNIRNFGKIKSIFPELNLPADIENVLKGPKKKKKLKPNKGSLLETF